MTVVAPAVQTERKWKRYPAYEASGIEWLGEVPTHWTVRRLKFACTLNPSKQEVAGLPESTTVSFLPMENIGEEGELILEETRSLEEVFQGYTYFRDGDVIVAKITPCFENGKGAICQGLTNAIGFGTTELHVLRPREGTDSKFIYYLTKSEPFRKLGTAAMYGAAGQKRVSDDFVANFECGFPPPSEQRAIARFLDRETGCIDTLVAKKERLVKLLQEKRTALISHAVTKGLNPNTPMKDSGVPWLGQVPAHWDAVRLKFLAEVRTGVAKGRSLNGETVEMPYLRVANVQDGYLDLADIATIEVLPAEIERYALQSGDVLMNEGGDYDKLGRGAVWKSQIDPCLHQNHVFAVRPHSVDPRWLTMITLASYAKHYFILRSKQSTNLASISSSNLQELPVLMPPETEQQEILDFLRRETERLDRLLSAVQEHISKLHEYRTALISAAVTGKIDVRK